jgi:hypothetical protein
MEVCSQFQSVVLLFLLGFMRSGGFTVVNIKTVVMWDVNHVVCLLAANIL